MSNLYNRIHDLCVEKGISVGKMCTELSISRGNLTELKKERMKTLKAENLTKIANYFNVSIDYLLDNSENPTVPRNDPAFSSYIVDEEKNLPDLNAEDRVDIAQRLNAIMSDLGSSDHALMFDGEPMDDETRELLRMSLKNQFEYTRRLAKKKQSEK